MNYVIATSRSWNEVLVQRLEEATGLSIQAPGFPAEMVDDEPEEPGYEVKIAAL